MMTSTVEELPTRLRHPQTQVVVTGFGPFRRVSRNPASDAACAAAEILGCEAELLPVTYEIATGFAHPHLERRDRVLFLHFGVATRRKFVALEHVARNTCRGPDVDGFEPDGVLESLGPELLETSLPVRAWRAELASRLEERWPVEVSSDAGNYVCNAIYYHTLRAVERHRASGHASDGVFVHIPPVDRADAQLIGQHVGAVVQDWLSG